MLKSKRQNNNWGETGYPIAFSDLVVYVNETKPASESSDSLILSIGDLCVLFKETLEQFWVESAVVYPIHLKELLLCHITELQAHKKGVVFFWLCGRCRVYPF